MEKKDFISAIRAEFSVSDKTAQQMLRLVEKAKNNDFLLGRYPFGNGIYANVEKYQTKENNLYERHEKYADVQIVLKGQEIIRLHPLDGTLRERELYDPSRDIAFLEGGVNSEPVPLMEGEFLIILPDMAHMPCMDYKGKHQVRKLVFKIPRNLIK